MKKPIKKSRAVNIRISEELSKKLDKFVLENNKPPAKVTRHSACIYLLNIGIETYEKKMKKSKC